MLLSELSPLVDAQQGAIYQMDASDLDHPVLRLLAGYAQRPGMPETGSWLGEGLVGPVRRGEAAHPPQQRPAGLHPGQLEPRRGLAPSSIVVLPVLFEGQPRLSSSSPRSTPFSITHLAFLDQLTQSIGVVLNTIEATMRTEGLLSSRSS
jgi:hypothetical protein